MCIAILSTAHPAYSLILLSNRDEFLERPTARSEWWDKPYDHVLAGRDLLRKEKGTWLGITADGRIAVLTNFREEGAEIVGGKSRGAMVTAWLQPKQHETRSVEDFAHSLIEDVGIHDVGGFSMIFGTLRKDRDSGLAVISNRTKSAGELARIATGPGETHGLSNSHFGDLTWPKVIHGEMLLSQAIKSNISRGDDEESLIKSLFDVLSVDTMTPKKAEEDIVTYMRQLRNSIFIPRLGGEVIETGQADVATSNPDDTHASNGASTISKEGLYGTEKQTLVLVSTSGLVTWIERKTNHDTPSSSDDAERRYTFNISGWES